MTVRDFDATVRESLQITEEGVRRPLSDGRSESVAWEDLMEIYLLTNDEGPFAEDCFYVLVGTNGNGVVVPLGNEKSADLLNRLQELPGFDNEAVIRAMQCSEHAKFVCWKRTGGNGAR